MFVDRSIDEVVLVVSTPDLKSPRRHERRTRCFDDPLEPGRTIGYVDPMGHEQNRDGLPEAPDKVYAIRVTTMNGPKDPQLAASLEAVRKARREDPNSWDNNPEKHREALEGLGRLLDEWQAENGAFTEEELARARALFSD